MNIFPSIETTHLTWFLDNALRELQIACTFRDQPDYAVNMIDGIWEYFSDIGDGLMAVAQGWMTAQEAFRSVLDKGWGG